MRSVDEHRRIVADLIEPSPREVRPLHRALGLVLADDVSSSIPLPPFDNSAMDGYAVRRRDIAHLPVTLPVSRDLPAGASDVSPLAEGTAARIMTGAPVPAGADAVVPVELTNGGVHTVTINEPPGDRTHIRLAGSDIVAGDRVVAAGTRLGPAHIGAAAAVGRDTVPVYAPKTVLVLSTGSELAEPGTPLRPGQIYESNGHMLAAAVTDCGAISRTAHFVADDVDAFRATVRASSEGVDVILTSGGVSAGAYEVVKDALAGGGVDFAKVAMQPGMPQGAGTLDGIPVVTLPGNPVSSFVSFEVFVRPAIRAAMGFADADRPTVRLPLAEAITSPAGKRQFRRGVVDAVAGAVAPVGGAGSHLLGALASADCLFVVPEEVESLPVGSEVEVWLLER